jgi:aminoglycoside phosphotransferase (APT) family kinase protein
VFGTSGNEEFRVMQGLTRAGYPVAAPRWIEPTGDVLGQPFFVMDYIAGAEGLEERAMDEPAARDFVRILHRLHELDWQAAALEFDLVPSAPGEASHVQIERWLGVYRAAMPEPIALLEEAAAWLHRHAPPLARMCVVHGDPGPGNLVHVAGRVVAVTDWEFAHLGDPREDWSFCLSMRGSRTLPRAQWLALYDELAGVRLDDDEWRYWEAFNLFKGACDRSAALCPRTALQRPSPPAHLPQARFDCRRCDC